MIFSFPVLRQELQHGTEKLQSFFFHASYHKDDSYNEIDGEKSQDGRSGFLSEGRGNKIALRCISLRAD